MKVDSILLCPAVVAGTSPGAACRPGPRALVVALHRTMSVALGICAKRFSKNAACFLALALRVYALGLGCSALGVILMPAGLGP